MTLLPRGKMKMVDFVAFVTYQSPSLIPQLNYRFVKRLKEGNKNLKRIELTPTPKF